MTETANEEEKPFEALAPISNARVAPAHGIAALALNMSLKFHDIATVQDGTLYQQYKLEGKNLTALHLDMVFETAMKMEAYLLGASERIANLVIDAITEDGSNSDQKLDQREKPDDGE
jgi:hypothetical protein